MVVIEYVESCEGSFESLRAVSIDGAIGCSVI